MFDAVILDCMYVVHKNWFKVQHLTTRGGVHTGLEFGFLKGLLATVRENTPAPVILAWDGRPSRCLKIYNEYKFDRDDSLHAHEAPWSIRIRELRLALEPLTPTLYHPEKEADELIAEFVYHQEANNKTTLIISTDADYTQLLSDLTFQIDTKGQIFGRPRVLSEYGVPPEKMVLLRSVSGDRSDKIKGIPRISKEANIRLATEARDLDHLLQLIDTVDYLTPRQREKLQQGKSIIQRNHELLKLPVTNGVFTVPTAVGDTTKIMDLCKRLELDSLIQRKEWTLFKTSPHQEPAANLSTRIG